MKALLDTNIFLEILLSQERASEAKELLLKSSQHEFFIFGLDFDDAYQYAIASRYDLALVSFDTDFQRTDRGHKLPSEVV